ncbi:MAG: energy transducer TonB [Gammaproteobacteria bacterium]|nr:energy transducer TonB [Gammaproteobacteria bacterium]
MQAQSKSFVITLLGAVCIHVAGFALAWKLDDDEKIVNPSLASSRVVLLNKPAPTKPTTEATTSFESFTPTHVAQFEPDSVAEVIPIPPPKPVEAIKRIIAKKVSHTTAIKTPPKPAKKISAAVPSKPTKKVSAKKLPKKERPQQKINPLIQPKSNAEESSTPYILASTFSTANTKKSTPSTAKTAITNAANNTALAEKDYYSELGTWLAKHKKYPRRARLRKQEGTAVLYFVVDRDGRVLEYLVEESSGHRLLDKEVTAMLKRAEPLPKIPDIMHQAKLEITVPVEFFLR